MQMVGVLAAGAALATGCYGGVQFEFDSGDSSSDSSSDGGGTDGTASDGTDGTDPDGPGDGGQDELLCTGPLFGPAGLRRLTREAYNNTIRDLLLDDSRPADAFELDGAVHETFASNVDGPPTETLVEDYMRVAESLAARATSQQFDALVQCDPSSGESCARTFVTTFGRRAWRRPLTESEVDELVALWSTGETFEDGVRLVIQAALQSPYFLYLVETGDSEAAHDGVVPLHSVELASRMSYFLWNSTPDDTLLEAAEGGALQTPQEIREQADRMLDDPRAVDAVRHFYDQWLALPELPTLANIDKDPSLYPEFDDTLRAAMVTEMRTITDFVARSPESEAQMLIVGSVGVVDDRLASLYGVDLQADAIDVPGLVPPPGFVTVQLDPQQRSGLLTMAGFATALSKPKGTSPVHRGAFVRERVFCQPLASAPSDVDNTPPPFNPDIPTREQYAQHSEDETCAGCHRLTDPIGFGLEQYDGFGRFRELDYGGVAIDATGELVQTDVDGPFDGGVELASKLAESEQVQRCMASMWFRFAFEAAESKVEHRCAIDELHDRLVEAGNLREMLIELVTSEAFRNRPQP
jgi:hypothetical protein